MAMDVVTALRAAGEPTRLRVLVALRQTQLNVGELCDILDQSQPRVSRHLKLLVDAGLISRSAEGTNAYFALADRGDVAGLLAAILDRVDATSSPIAEDLAALDRIRVERARSARDYFERIAAEWEQIRPLHVADEEVEAAMLAEIDGRAVRRLVDIGTGTGRILELFGPRVEQAVGIDTSAAMLRGARAHLDEPGLEHVSVRLSDAAELELPDGHADLVVLHHVLHFVEDPGAVLAEAARITAAEGVVLIVDFGPHAVESLRRDFAHRHLGFGDELQQFCDEAGLAIDHTIEFSASTSPTLPVRLWRASPVPVPHPIASPT